MFTGLIQGQGEVLSLQRLPGQCRLTIRTLFAFPDLTLGESIAVNGVCLTAEKGTQEQKQAIFTAYASAETLQRTNLGLLTPGMHVNLERALAIGDRLGGHIVSGHVDTVATVRLVEPRGDSRLIRFAFPFSFAPEVIEKGSVTLDGISLTINACTDETLDVNVIPETWKVTTAARWTPGAQVNMETDVLGKYVRRNLLFLGTTSGGKAPSSGGVSLDLLRENGFLS